MNGEKVVKTSNMFQTIGGWIGIFLLFTGVCAADAWGCICLAGLISSETAPYVLEQTYIYDRIQEKDCLREITERNWTDRV